ncbi:MAG: hypothetical protein AAGG48_16595 [Planctomycetota bacterium]
MNQLSFRGVLGTLQIAQIESYLTESGWSATRPMSAPVQQYVLAIEGTDRNYQLTLPMDRSHSAYTDQLYRLVFNVSCIEDREPMDVAQDMRSQSHSEVGDPVLHALEQEWLEGQVSEFWGGYEQTINELQPSIARAEFMSAALGDGTTEAITMRTAIILVPLSKRLSARNRAEASELVARLVTRILRVAVPDPESLLSTFCSDSEDAPSATLAALKALR